MLQTNQVNWPRRKLTAKIRVSVSWRLVGSRPVVVNPLQKSTGDARSSE